MPNTEIKTKITIAYGDGIGPEIMDATLRILKAAGARLDYEEIKIGEKLYLAGNPTGVEPDAWDTVIRNGIFLKSPITTPSGGGYKSLNVTARKMLGLFSNVRPVTTLQPYVDAKHSMDLVIVRENEEDLYAGIEYQQTSEMVECLKLISHHGSEKIIRYAFEYAKAYNRKKVSCFSKDNIMKMTDGLFHKIFDEVAKEYPDIVTDHRIIDIGSALLADSPEKFDVIVTLNLYGDIISDIAAQVAGSVGLCGSANIGDSCAMFEAIHGSAPDIAGKNIANPSGLLNGAIMMLVHINQPDIASKIHNAWLSTLESGFHTSDIYKEGISAHKCGTKEFADAVINHLGQLPKTLKVVEYGASGDTIIKIPTPKKIKKSKVLVGVDVFIDWDFGTPNELAEAIIKATENKSNLQVAMISNRGTNVWPNGLPQTYCIDHFRLRYFDHSGNMENRIEASDITTLLLTLNEAGFDTIKTENLYYLDGVRGFSLA